MVVVERCFNRFLKRRGVVLSLYSGEATLVACGDAGEGEGEKGYRQERVKHFGPKEVGAKAPRGEGFDHCA